MKNFCWFLFLVLHFGLMADTSSADAVKRGYVVDAFQAPYGTNFNPSVHGSDFISQLAADKANLVNLTFAKTDDAPSYEDFTTALITRLAEVLPPLQANGITSVVAILYPPGGRKPVGGKPREVMFEPGNGALKTAHIEAWRRIAQQFNSQSKLTYLPLLEGAGTKTEVIDHLVNLTAAIRGADSTPAASQPPIILQPPYGNLKFVRQLDFSRFSEGRYFVSANFYPLFDYQHQGTAADRNNNVIITYPGGKTTKLTNGKRIRALRGRALTKRQINYSIVGLRSNVQGQCNYSKSLVKKYPASGALQVLGGLIGEYAVPNYAPGADKFIKDTNKVFTACRIWSANHARYGDPKWDVTLLCDRKTNQCPQDPGNKRHTALKNIFQKNSF